MLFKDDEHEREYNRIYNKMRQKDVYHSAAAYIISLDTVCREHNSELFDFEADAIKPEALSRGWQTGTSRKSTRLLFNLWNGYTLDESGEDNSRYYAVDEIFCCSLAPYYWEAVKIRYPEYAGGSSE